MSSADDPKGALRAAEIAVANDDLETAENACLEAISRIRQQKEGDLDGR